MNAPAARRALYAFATLLISLGLVFLVGGLRLITLGGSWYYTLAGSALVASGALLWRCDRRGSFVYGGMLAATLLWSLHEVGVDLWALAPRLLMLSVIGLWFLVPWVRRPLHSPKAPPPLFRTREGVSVAASVLVVSVTLLALGGFRTPVNASPGRGALAASTGEPLSAVEERLVPQGAVPEDWIAKTQPFSIGMPDFRDPDWTEADMWGLTPLDQLWYRIEFRKLR